MPRTLRLVATASAITTTTAATAETTATTTAAAFFTRTGLVHGQAASAHILAGEL